MRRLQSLAQLERAFVEETQLERTRREQLRRSAAVRSRQRRIERIRKRGSVRFTVLVLTLVGTAVIVAVAMFETLYYVMG
jgi:hypothetical protein